MNREQELALINRCIESYENNTTTSGPQGSIDTSRYTSQGRFALEQERFFSRLPAACAHSSELAEPNTFRRITSPLGDLFATRDASGQAHVFYNACRHRGSTLVLEEAGRTPRLTCPYHAWSYNTGGELTSINSQGSTFPGIDKSSLHLAEIPTVERLGFIWTCPTATNNTEAEALLDAHLGGIATDLEWLQIDKLHVCDTSRKVWHANWKILTEGGMESYHFSIAHRDTIAPYFLNNTAVSDEINGHNRMVLPHRAIDEVIASPEEERWLRNFTHINYTIMGSCGLLVQKEHVDWFTFRPLSAGETEITICSLIPENPAHMDEQRREHWRKNFDITEVTLNEDFVIGEGIQRSVQTGALPSLNFGTSEWALKAFNDYIDRQCVLP